jgi:molybdopterin-guanine dinucleotide biosynthesis protein A
MQQIDIDSIEGFVLAGGASSRMGTDKSKLVLNGQTLIKRISDALSGAVSNVTIVGSDQGESGLPTVPDVFKKWGALGGLHAALANCDAQWAIVVACDLPFVTPGLFSRLIALREGFDAVAPLQEDGRQQPLCAIFRVDICLPLSEKLINAGERRPVTLLQSVRTRWVAFEELKDLEGADQFFDNLNTPEDYVQAQRKGEAFEE